jgi:hypothetical protein
MQMIRWRWLGTLIELFMWGRSGLGEIGLRSM